MSHIAGLHTSIRRKVGSASAGADQPRRGQRRRGVRGITGATSIPCHKHLRFSPRNRRGRSFYFINSLLDSGDRPSERRRSVRRRRREFRRADHGRRKRVGRPGRRRGSRSAPVGSRRPTFPAKIALFCRARASIESTKSDAALAACSETDPAPWRRSKSLP
jgi:hypothetical protein